MLRPGEVGYDEARQVWNGLIDRRPALIARCATVADVVAAVNLARDTGLLVAVRGGGHNVAGYAVCHGGVMIDLSPMKAIAVDPASRTAVCQPGVTWGEPPGNTGVWAGGPWRRGFHHRRCRAELGGGIGWLRRKWGLACDNLRAVEIVTAQGQLLRGAPAITQTCSGACEAGAGIPVATSFEFQLHPVGPTVAFAGVMYPAEKGAAILRAWRDFMAEAPDEICSDAIWLTAPADPAYPAHTHGKAVVFIQAIYAGSVAAGDTLRPLRAIDVPLADLSGPL